MTKTYGEDTKFLKYYYDNEFKLVMYFKDKLSGGYEISLYYVSKSDRKLNTIFNVTINGTFSHIDSFIRAYEIPDRREIFFKLQPGATGRDIADHVSKKLFPGKDIFFCAKRDFENAYLENDFVSGKDINK